jgi:hypothetical protein
MSEFSVKHNIGAFPKKLQQLPVAVQKAVLDELKPQAEQEALRLFQRAVATWRHKPQFRARSTGRAASITVGSGSVKA